MFGMFFKFFTYLNIILWKYFGCLFLLKININYTMIFVDNYLVIKTFIPIANYLQALPKLRRIPHVRR